MSISIPYHHRNLRGNGLSNVFKTMSGVIRPLFNTAKTLLKPATKQLGKEGLSLITSTAGDILNGKPVKKSVKKNIKKSQRRIGRKVKQLAKGTGTKKKTRQKTKKNTGKKRTTKKKSKKSIFDGYDL